mmetsp:Transcript_47437/g.132193  ORF Transcript_47437/g.132193 Transcript_47437/m.132193 type:complete len:135 (+) Transcript_47437:3-407(+)
MSKIHFCRTWGCKLIPSDVKAHLISMQKVNRRASGGKEYWAECLRVMGIYEDGGVMRYRHSSTTRTEVPAGRTSTNNDAGTTTTTQVEAVATTTNNASNSTTPPGQIMMGVLGSSAHDFGSTNLAFFGGAPKVE